MALINWGPKYSVGISTIDAQHQKLVNIINDLNDAMRNGKSKEVLNVTLTSLIDYTKIHFKYEEDLFNKYSYPEKLSHKMIHDKLTKQVLDFYDKYQKGNATVSIELMSFLSDWLLKHINGEDKKYTEFLNKNGVK
ncbi:MAG TPA: bacteriohemerythrin [Melioribacteraceae bacterium]|nr:bacteriohemerythrin [Melioribacteraceae bacterium]